MRCCIVGFDGGTRRGEVGGDDETRAAAAGGTDVGEVGGTEGDFGTAGGEIIFGGATGGEDFAPEGGASVAGARGFGSTGATGAAGICGGVITAGGMIGGAAGGATGGFASTRGVAAGVSLTGGTTVGAGACKGGIEPGTETGGRTSGLEDFSAAGVVGAGIAASLLCNSPTARCNFVCWLAFSSASSFSCLRSFASRAKRAMVKKGVTSSSNPKRTSKRMAKGMGVPRTHRLISSDGRTAKGRNLAFCSLSP
jgi:hypothetical protein